MPSYRINRCTQSRDGAVLVEFAIVLPIILVIFAGMIEISRVLLLQHSADTAAYEGARCAMVPGATSSDATQAAELLLELAGLESSVVTVSPELIQEDTSLITVRVEIPIAANAWIAPQWFQGSRVVSETTLYCERPPMIQLTGVPTMSAKVKASKAAKGTPKL